jgi:hypothetical protein
MNRIVWITVTGGLVGWGIAGVLGGCGSEEAAVVEEPDAASSSSGTSGTSSSGSSGDMDGGNDGASSSSGGASNPFKVTCGATECDAGGPGGFCCINVMDGGRTCGTGGASCPGIAFEIRCDEKADCTDPQEKCCLGFTSTTCNNDCPGPGNGIQVCKTAAECGDAGPCNMKMCGNRQWTVCGSPAGCQ